MSQYIFRRPVGLAVFPRLQHWCRNFSTVLDAPVGPQTQGITLPVAQRAPSVYENARNATGPRRNWTKDEIAEVYNMPLIDLTHASVCVCNIIQRTRTYDVDRRLQCIADSMTQLLFRCAHCSISKSVAAVRTVHTARSHLAITPASKPRSLVLCNRF